MGLPLWGGLNLDQIGTYYRRLKFTILFWSGKTQKVYPVLEPRTLITYPVLELTTPSSKQNYVLYCIVLETKTTFMLYSFNQMILPFHFSSTMFVQKSFKFSITATSLSYDVCTAF